MVCSNCKAEKQLEEINTDMVQRETRGSLPDGGGLWSSTRTMLLPGTSVPESIDSSAAFPKQRDPKDLNLQAIIEQLATEHELMYEVALSKWHPDDA